MGIMEKKMETTIVYWGYILINITTTIIINEALNHLHPIGCFLFRVSTDCALYGILKGLFFSRSVGSSLSLTRTALHRWQAINANAGHVMATFGGFPKLGLPFWGVSMYWVPATYGNYYSVRSRLCVSTEGSWL